MKNIAAVQTWQNGHQVPPPKDREFMAIGAVYYDDGAVCESVPFSRVIEWRDLSGEMGWGYREGSYYMSLRMQEGDVVVIHWWIDLPQVAEPVNECAVAPRGVAA